MTHQSVCAACNGRGENHHPGIRLSLSGRRILSYDPEDEAPLPCSDCEGTGFTLAELSPLQDRALGVLIRDKRTGARHVITRVPDGGGWLSLNYDPDHIISTEEFVRHYMVEQRRPTPVEVDRFASRSYHDSRVVVEGWQVIEGGRVTLPAREAEGVAA